jgi:hypothetical protein
MSAPHDPLIEKTLVLEKTHEEFESNSPTTVTVAKQHKNNKKSAT